MRHRVPLNADKGLWAIDAVEIADGSWAHGSIARPVSGQVVKTGLSIGSGYGPLLPATKVGGHEATLLAIGKDHDSPVDRGHTLSREWVIVSLPSIRAGEAV